MRGVKKNRETMDGAFAVLVEYWATILALVQLYILTKLNLPELRGVVYVPTVQNLATISKLVPYCTPKKRSFGRKEWMVNEFVLLVVGKGTTYALAQPSTQPLQIIERGDCQCVAHVHAKFAEK